jgi:general secretion pathway protein I
MTKNKLQLGFTLIEVMIALSVVAIGLMATLKAVNDEISSANIVRNKMIALWVMENKVAEIRMNPVLPGVGVNQGQQTLYNQIWHWQTNTTNTANTKIRKVEVAIFAADENDKKNPVITQNIYLADFK